MSGAESGGVAAWRAAELQFLQYPAGHLRAFLERAAPVVERYTSKGKVRPLADRADGLVRDLEAPQVPASFGLFAFGTGCAADPQLTSPRRDHRPAEAACNALAEELRRAQKAEQAGRRGGERAARGHAMERSSLRDGWERARRRCVSDAEADRVIGAEEGLAAGTVKRRRLNAEKISRWAR